jgi:C4-dicarboxylate-specific signal transduction histidine kinase
MRTAAALEAQERERRWLRLAAWELATTHPRTVFREALGGAIDLVADRLRTRLAEGEQAAGSAPPDESAWRHLAEATAREVATVLIELGETVRKTGILPRRVDVNELVGWAIEIVRTRIDAEDDERAARVNLRFEPTPEPLVIEGSVVLLGALVLAIENAIEAVPSAGHVRVCTNRDDSRVLINVIDERPGIAEEHRQSAFSPFFAAVGRPHLGLGLSVVRTLVMRHGGLAELVPGETGGLTLAVSLPAAPAPRPAPGNAG